MPTNRFGSVNTEPIYNVTGRNPRDIGQQGSGPGMGAVLSAGVSKNFGADAEYQPKPGYFNQNLMGWNPLNPLSKFGQRMMFGGGTRGGGDGDGSKGGDTYNVYVQSGHKAFSDSGNVTTGDITAVDSDFREALKGGDPYQQSNQNIASTQAQPGQPARAPRVRKPLTQEQRDRKNAAARKRRAEAKTQPAKTKPMRAAASATPSQRIMASPSVNQSNSPVTTNVGGNF